jgi:hypothetical protein
MTYLDALDSELATAGIPARRRARIISEFTDHLAENPEAELGAPRDLARQFADELGTRLARVTAYRAFVALAGAAGTLVVMFLLGGRTNGWVGYGSFNGNPTERWYIPMLFVCAAAAQVALAAGSLALIRAWRLRHAVVISHADALILNRRAAVGLVAGAMTMMVMPLTFFGFRHMWATFDNLTDPGARWFVTNLILGSVAVIGLLSLLPSVLTAIRLRPSLEGEAGDIRADIGFDDPRITPWRVALCLSGVILIALTLAGVAADDPYDGLARGLLDAAACMVGFAILGRYLGLRTVGSQTVGGQIAGGQTPSS